jgi:hypothetical protein
VNNKAVKGNGHASTDDGHQNTTSPPLFAPISASGPKGIRMQWKCAVVMLLVK